MWEKGGRFDPGGGVAPLGVAVAVALPVSVPVALGVSVSVSVAARRPVSGETCKKERVFSPPPGASREGPTSRVQSKGVDPGVKPASQLSQLIQGMVRNKKKKNQLGGISSVSICVDPHLWQGRCTLMRALRL